MKLGDILQEKGVDDYFISLFIVNLMEILNIKPELDTPTEDYIFCNLYASDISALMQAGQGKITKAYEMTSAEFKEDRDD